jgi:hypothetical protein
MTTRLEATGERRCDGKETTEEALEERGSSWDSGTVTNQITDDQLAASCADPCMFPGHMSSANTSMSGESTLNHGRFFRGGPLRFMDLFIADLHDHLSFPKGLRFREGMTTVTEVLRT